MKIGMQEVLSGIEQTAIKKISKELTKKGFTVNEHFRLFDNKIVCDLYAENGEDKRIYELKIGKNRIQKKQYSMLQSAAKQLGARLFIVYLEVPRSKKISYDGLEQIIKEDLQYDLPVELAGMSTHTTIDSIDDIEIDTLNIANGLINITGSGNIGVSLWFTPKNDIPNNLAIEDQDVVGFFFKLSIDISNNKVLKRYYKIDSGEQ